MRTIKYRTPLLIFVFILGCNRPNTDIYTQRLIDAAIPEVSARSKIKIDELKNDYKYNLVVFSDRRCIQFMSKKPYLGGTPVICFSKKDGRIVEYFDKDGW